MSQALIVDRTTKPFASTSFTTLPRPTLKSLTATPSVTPLVDASGVASLDHMIESIDKATYRMAALLKQLRDQQCAIDELREENSSLHHRVKIAENDAKQQEVRASEASLKVELLQAQQQLNLDEQDRLKTSINTLLAMFGGEDKLILSSK